MITVSHRSDSIIMLKGMNFWSHTERRDPRNNFFLLLLLRFLLINRFSIVVAQSLSQLHNKIHFSSFIVIAMMYVCGLRSQKQPHFTTDSPNLITLSFFDGKLMCSLIQSRMVALSSKHSGPFGAAQGLLMPPRPSASFHEVPCTGALPTRRGKIPPC